MSLHDARQLHRAAPQVLDTDPFWSVVRRRHPDVDVVLLPSDGPPGPEEETLDAGAVRSAVDDLIDAWARIRPILLAAAPSAPDASLPPLLRWGAGEVGHALLLEKAATGLGQEGGTALLRSLVAELGAVGWTFRPGSRNEMPFLAATSGRIDLEATAGPAATVISVATGLLPVGADDRAAVLSVVREEVASWA